MEEFKKQIREEFDNKFPVNIQGYFETGSSIDEAVPLNDIKSFIDSLIDKTVQMTEERIVGVVQEAYVLKETDSLETNKRLFGLTQEIISLITNKSDINK